jgi:hypothetical protein
VVVVGLTGILTLAEPVVSGPVVVDPSLYEYVKGPTAPPKLIVKEEDCPSQIESVPTILAVGMAFTVTLEAAVPSQPFASVTVTVTGPAVPVVIVWEVAPVLQT